MPDQTPQTITLVVRGDPKGQPRPRAFARRLANGQVMARVYEAGTAEGWKSQVAAAARDQVPMPPLQGPLSVSLTLYFRRPRCHFLKAGLRPTAPTHHITKPDADNAAKAVLDALTSIGMWGDDSQIARLVVEKFYGSPGAEVRIERLEETGQRRTGIVCGTI